MTRPDRGPAEAEYTRGGGVRECVCKCALLWAGAPGGRREGGGGGGGGRRGRGLLRRKARGAPCPSNKAPQPTGR